jgi:hypothetical protein
LYKYPNSSKIYEPKFGAKTKHAGNDAWW